MQLTMVFSLYLSAIYTLNIHSFYSELQETQKRDDRQLGEETKPTKASEIIPSKMLSVTAKDLEGVPA